MTTITIDLPEDVAARLEVEHISVEQLNSFLLTAIEALLMRRQVAKREQVEVERHPWTEAFQDSAVAFVDRLIDENRALFEELARL